MVALRILVDVVVFRVLRLEMANLAGAVAIMLVLRLEFPDMVYRTAVGLLLNVLVYLNNDYLDVVEDMRCSDRDSGMTSHLHENMGAAKAAQWFLVASLVVLGGIHSWGLLAAAFAGGIVCVAYSARLKRMPYLDVVAMTAWGVAMPMVGFPLDSALGWCLAIQLGLFSSVFEPLQVVRDRAADEAVQVRTTAVVLGTPRTIMLARFNMTLCAAYAAAVLSPWVGLWLLLAVFIPVSEAQAGRDWQRIKICYGVGWLLCCGLTYMNHGTSGLLLQLSP